MGIILVGGVDRAMELPFCHMTPTWEPCITRCLDLLLEDMTVLP